jgi:hypothetical protein
MPYPKIDKYDCDHCIRRNVYHSTDSCVNITSVNGMNYEKYKELEEKVEKINARLGTQIKLLHTSSHFYKFCKSLLEILE